MLDDSNIVQAYIQEFEKITQNHSKVKYLWVNRKTEAKVEPNQYLQTDYLFQAKKEKEKGNDLAAAKIYTEILKLDNKREDIIIARNKILNKLNEKRLTICPFEIGFLYENGYSSIIPAFMSLPFTHITESFSSVDYAKSVLVTIQKYDYIHKTILEFSVNNIKRALKESQKFEDTFTIDENGILTVISKELNGNGRIGFGRVDLKTLL